jgi:hypothetical protein
MADPYSFANLAPNEVAKAKDLFRAYGLSPLPLERGAEGFDVLPAQSREQLFRIIRQAEAPAAEKFDVTVTGEGGRPLGTALPGPAAAEQPKATTNRFDKYINPPDETAPASAPAATNRFTKYIDEGLPAPRPSTTFGEDLATIAREVINPNLAPYATVAGGGALVGGIPGAALATGGLLASDLLAGGIVNPVLQAFGRQPMMTPSEAINAMYGPDIVAPEATSSGRRAARTIGAFVAPTRGTIGAARGFVDDVTGNVIKGEQARNALIEPGVTRNVLTTLAEKPGVQTASAIGAGTAVGAGQEAGVTDPFQQLLLAAAGGIAPSVASAAVKPAIRTVYNITEPFLPGGAEKVKARAYLEAFDNDPNKVQQAINLLELGTPPEKVATAMNASGFAALLGSARNANTIVKDLYLARDAALQQSQANRLATASRSVNALQADLDQQQKNRLVALSEQDEMAQRAVREERERLAGRLPKESQLKIGDTVTERRADELDRVKTEIVQPAYRAAFDAAPEPFSFDLVAQTARALMDDAGYVFNPEQAPKAAKAVAEYQAKAVRQPYATLMGEPPVRREPTMITLEYADAFVQAINEDLATIGRGNDPSANKTVANLMQLKRAAEQAIEAGTQGTEAAKLYKDARTAHREQVIGRFRTGWVSDLERQTVTNEQKLAPESVVKTILEGEQNALRFVAALGEDPLAVDAVRRGIVDRYRRAVVRDGVINPSKSADFLRVNDDALNTLEESGIKILDDLRQFDENAARLAEAGETATTRVAAEFEPRLRELKELERRARTLANRVGVAPEKSAEKLDTLAQSSEDVATVINDIRQALLDKRRFKTLVREGVAAGGGVRELTAEQAGPKLQVFDQLFTFANFLLTRAQGRVDAKLAVDIAQEMLNSDPAAKALAEAMVKGKRSEFGEMLQKPASRPGPGAAVNVLAPVVTNQNALRE